MKSNIFLTGLLILLAAVGCDKNKLNTEQKQDPPQADKYDLSASGSANCYIVNEEGTYSFDATVMGNGQGTKGMAATSLAPSSASLLWQDAKGLIEDIKYENGRIRFTVSKDAASVGGNAVIAARDQDGTILWNWHIWITSYSPSPLSGERLNGVVWMDRNLGAMSEFFDAEGKAKGLVYQWGRKDPFPAPQGWETAEVFNAFDSNGENIYETFANVVNKEASNLDNAIRNPMTFYSGVRSDDGLGPYDWMTTTDYSMQNDYLWAKETTGEKTLFDPCPPGWKVPEITSFKGLNNNSFPSDGIFSGREHNTIGYFPACGIRGFEGGIWTSISATGDYWSSNADDNGFANILHFIESTVNPVGKTYRAAGLPVRCVSENKEISSGENEYDIEIKADNVFEASYIKGEGSDGSANYYIGLSNVVTTVDENGQIVPAAPGELVFFDLYGEPSKDAENAILPDGSYTLNSITNSGCANAEFTWVRYCKEDMKVQYHLFNDGDITVKRGSDDIYSIEGIFTTNEGLKMHILCKTQIKFTNQGAEQIQTVIENPVNSTYSDVDVIFEHTAQLQENSYDRYSINLWDGKLDENGQVLTDGYVLHIDLQTEPLSTKDNIQLKEGIYKASNDYAPGNFMRGDVFSLLGVPVYVGTYCQEVRPTNQAVLYGFANEGTIEIKRSGDNYEFIIDFTTPEGVRIQGHYPMGKVNMIDNSPSMPGGDWHSVLREDKTLIFQESDDVYAYGYIYGDYYYPKTTQYQIYVNNHSSNESFYLEFLAPENAESPVGTYTAAKDPENPVAGEFIPGYKDLSIFNGTWGYIYCDESGYEAGGAPATEGTLTITDAGEGKFKFELQMKDDAKPKNNISATWTGKVKLTKY